MSDRTEKTETDYSLVSRAVTTTFPAPVLPYAPPLPKHYRPKIGMIGCGGITQTHCAAYRNAGFDVVLLCDRNRERAEKRQREFFPNARVTTDYHQVLDRPDIAVVDITTHPEERLALIEEALSARKHVLSQKPFVLDLDDGERLADLADRMGVKLAVNQNGRWAPHLSYLREAVRAGCIGDVLSVHTRAHWDHSWVAGTPFAEMPDLLLYDFAIHWFDFACTIVGDRPLTSVFATRSPAIGQTIAPPLLAQAMYTFPEGHGSLVFDGALRHAPQDATYIGGTTGTLQSVGPDLGTQTVTLTTSAGIATPTLAGTWFPDGFRGTMGELLCAIEEDRQPMHSGRNNLRSLALCFAAIASANDGVPKVPGDVRRLPVGSLSSAEKA